jgi:hypothetical protein
MKLCASSIARQAFQESGKDQNGPVNPTGQGRDSTRGPEDRASPQSVFVTTHWSLVLKAGGDTTRARAPLEQLCRQYWRPLYHYIRRRGYGVEDAQDLAQGFFARLLERQVLAQADPHRGRFRSFLLAVSAGVTGSNQSAIAQSPVQSSAEITRARMESLLTAARVYEVDIGKYTSSLDALLKNPGDKKWKGPYIKTKEWPPTDAWGTPLPVF